MDQPVRKTKTHTTSLQLFLICAIFCACFAAEQEFLIEQAVEKHRNMIKQLKGVPGVVPERYEGT